jgi:hypothetical protein
VGRVLFHRTKGAISVRRFVSISNNSRSSTSFLGGRLLSGIICRWCCLYGASLLLQPFIFVRDCLSDQRTYNIATHKHTQTRQGARRALRKKCRVENMTTPCSEASSSSSSLLPLLSCLSCRVAKEGRTSPTSSFSFRLPHAALNTPCIFKFRAFRGIPCGTTMTPHYLGTRPCW